MRVLHLVHGSPLLGAESGGTERYVDALAKATGGSVFTRDRSQVAPLYQDDEAGYPLWVLGLPTSAGAVFRDTFECRPVAEAVGILVDREHFDLVHGHHLAHLGFNVVTAIKRRGIPLAFTLHDYHLACARGQLVDRHLSPCAGPSPARCAPCLAEHLQARSGLSRAGRALPGTFATRLGRRLLGSLPIQPEHLQLAGERNEAGRAVLAQADAVISPSHSLAGRMEELNWVDSTRLHVVDLPLVGPVSPAPPAVTGPVRFLFVGSLIPTKGPQILVEAFDGLAEADLTLYGPVPDYDGQPGFGPRLLRQIERCHGARYGGIFGSAERTRIYAEADVLVLPSTWEENSPLVAREAAAAGLRVVASAVGGIKEIVPNARMVPPGDVQALKAALLLERQKGRGRNPARSWPMDQHIRDLEGVYETILGETHNSPTGLR